LRSQVLYRAAQDLDHNITACCRVWLGVGNLIVHAVCLQHRFCTLHVLFMSIWASPLMFDMPCIPLPHCCASLLLVVQREHYKILDIPRAASLWLTAVHVHSWAAQYNIWLLIILMPKGVVLSVLHAHNPHQHSWLCCSPRRCKPLSGIYFASWVR